MAKKKSKQEEDDDDSDLDMLWALIPMLGLLIPITAVAQSAVITVSLIVMMMLFIGGVISYAAMNRRHQQRLEILEAQARVAEQERLSLNEANRVIDRDNAITELRESLRATPEQPTPTRPAKHDTNEA